MLRKEKVTTGPSAKTEDLPHSTQNAYGSRFRMHIGIEPATYEFHIAPTADNLPQVFKELIAPLTKLLDQRKEGLRFG